MSVTRLQRRLSLGCVLLMAPLLFLGGPDYYSPRSVALGWQLGHPFLFFLLVNLLWDTLSSRGERAWPWSFGFALIATFLAGGVIEWGQQFVGRQSSWEDLRLDLIGAALGAGWNGLRTGGNRVWMPRALLAVAGLALVVMDLRPLAVALLDEYRMRRAFPVLSDFSSELELGRWNGSFPLRLVPAPEGGEGLVLRVDLRSAPYAGFKLRYFEGDWRGFAALSIHVFNPQPEVLNITCRINDRQHEDDNRFTDRYNRRFSLPPGWSRIDMPLTAVRAAPRGRETDLKRITGLGCFTARSGVTRVLFVGTTRLMSSW